MTRSADLRFLLPSPPRSVALLGPVPGTAAAWSDAGVAVRAPGAAADVLVAPAPLLRATLAHAPPMLLILGRVPLRPLRAAGYQTQRVLALPTPAGPRLLVPLPSPAAVRAALAPVGRRAGARALARAVALAAIERGQAPARALLTVAARQVPRPWLLAATDHPLTPWYLWLGSGDPLQRAVLHVLGSDGGRVIKFSRIAGNTAPFQQELRAAEATVRLPSAARTHTPGLTASGVAAGLPYLVERRFPGRPLTEILVSRWPTARRLQHVERVAEWLHHLAATTRLPAAALAGARDRLACELASDPHRHDGGPIAPLITAIASVPGVLAHNDVGSWNVVADGSAGFGVVDWESAADPGFPLWDLVYFLGDALTLVEARRFPGRTEHLVRLFRGASPHSALLFAHVRRAIGALDIEPAAVGPLVTLCWMHHGLSPTRRRQRLDTIAGAARPDDGAPIPPLARRWLREPGLGTRWSAWR